MTKYKRLLSVILLLACCCICFIKCVDGSNKSPGENDPALIPPESTIPESNIKFAQFAGSAACRNCHQDIYEKHLATGHHLTSQPAEEKYIRGSFKKGKNEFAYPANVKVKMEKRDSGLFQVVYHNGDEKRALRFGMITGSGAKGQSFIYTRDHFLFQMPVTYYTAANQWSNSPGFPAKIMMDRPITARCLECHTTYAETISPPGKEPEAFDTQKILFGVDCERCHGPAAEHVVFHTANPGDTQAKHIINTASLSRQQQLDLCALCHGGAMSKTKPSFEFVAGDTLSNFFRLRSFENATPNYDNIDVHGNQYGLLRASKCFQRSVMTCNSCHDAHANERGKLEVMSAKCMKCHSASHEKVCKMTASIGATISKNCIDCHMPTVRSKAITVQLPGQEIPSSALVRSHFVGIYPAQVKKFVTGK